MSQSIHLFACNQCNHWPAPWRALSEQGLSEHMIWMIQYLYRDQQGQVVGSNGCSRSFARHGGVRQGCVLSPRLFCSVLEMSIANWRDEMEHLGLNLDDGGRSLLDLRFADDILIFGTNYHVIGVLLDKLVENLAGVGLQLNAQKTKVLTTQAQPPSQLQTPNGLIISVLDRESRHKWLGCMLTTTPVQTTTCDVECRLQAAAKAFNAHRWILCDPKVSMSQKLEYFDRVISPIACFAAGHRTIYRNDLRSMDVAYRRQWWGLLAIWTGHYHGMKFHWWGVSCSRRTQPASHCGGISQPARQRLRRNQFSNSPHLE